MTYLLDTNVVSEVLTVLPVEPPVDVFYGELRNPRGRIAGRIAQIGEAEVATSIIVAAELRFGAAKKASVRLSSQLEAILEVLTVLPVEPPVDVFYGELRNRLEREGQPIGGNDLLIAAQSLTLGLTQVTDNERELGRIEDLPLANWLR